LWGEKKKKKKGPRTNPEILVFFLTRKGAVKEASREDQIIRPTQIKGPKTRKKENFPKKKNARPFQLH